MTDISAIIFNNIEKEFGCDMRKLIESKCLPNLVNQIKKKTETKKVKSKVVDSEKPKRPLSAFFVYCQEQRAQTQTNFPDLKPKEISCKLGEMWKELSDDEKSKYKSQPVEHQKC